MKNKINKSNKQKNSKLVTKENQTSKTNEKFNITSESSVLITFYEQGAIKTPDFSGNPKAKTEYHKVVTKTRINSDSVQFFTSEDGCPSRTKYSKFIWDKMSKKQRLEANIEYTANGRKYEYVIIN